MNTSTKRRLFVIAILVAASVLFVTQVFASPAAMGKRDYTWRNVEIVGGGYVPGIIFNSSEPDLVYARTDIGGAYRWDPKAERWIPLLDWVGWDDWGLTGVDSLATDPVDPNRVYVLAGTYTNDWDPGNGAILRSKNRGRTWRRTDLPFKSGGNMPGRNMGERLVIDPNDNSILYLGTRSGNGLWRSTDYGKSWSQVTSFPAVGSYAQDPSDTGGYLSDPLGVVWVVFDPQTGSPGSATQTIYVGVADLGTSIYRSTDGGETWEALPGQPTDPPFMPHHAKLASNGVMYITYNNNGGPYDGSMGDVWKYDTGTETWTNINPDPSSTTNSWFGYGGLAVDAQNPDTVMVAALNMWWPDVVIWRSTDGGATWSRIWDFGAEWPNRDNHYVQDISAAPWLDWGASPALPEVSPKLGWMVGDLDIDPFNSDKMLYGTGATIYGTNNLTEWDAGNPITISVQAQGLEETSVQDLISPPEGAPLISALADIAGFRHDDLSVVPSTMFLNPYTGTTSSLDYAELSPNIIVRTGWGDNGNAGYSTDGGSTWIPMATEPEGSGGGVIAVAADGASIVWSTGGAVYYSLDNGNTWTASAGISGDARVATDRVDSEWAYAFAAGTFYVSKDRGATFTATTATGLPAEGPVRFKAVPDHRGHVWLAGGSDEEGVYGLWFSRNAGATFTKLRHIEEADTIGFGKAAPWRRYPALYISAQIHGVRGIYRSDNGGRSWVRINDDDHQYAWTGAAITGDPRVYGRVYISTNGRGILYGDLSHPHPQH
ncbi:MAG: xyloglucanase [Anaerolineae bacterium]|nr:xyloglucanase [Anaerolineae bacterium]